MVTFDQPKIMYQKKEGEESYIRTLGDDDDDDDACLVLFCCHGYLSLKVLGCQQVLSPPWWSVTS